MINMHEVASEYRLSHWSGVIRERNTSGLSIKAYCESIGVRPNVYFYWQRKLREAACQELLPAAMTSVDISKAPKSSIVQTASIPAQAPGWAVCEIVEPPTTPVSREVVIEIGKSRVTAVAETDLEHLSNVCRMLMSLC